ncbi:MAG: hypothetical protein JKY85_04600 [Porticoccus sp.]|nr:hypothetical protein [Porticoccus sp.]
MANAIVIADRFVGVPIQDGQLPKNFFSIVLGLATEFNVTPPAALRAVILSGFDSKSLSFGASINPLRLPVNLGTVAVLNLYDDYVKDSAFLTDLLVRECKEVKV